MKSKVVLLVLALLMAGSFTTAAVALAKADDGNDRDERPRSGQMQLGWGQRFGDDGESADRPGPPPWAAGKGRDHRRGDHRGPGGKFFDRDERKAWLDAWRDLTPAERAERMAELAQQHADGIKKWARCVREAGSDSAARRACERPIPPGLAKKLLRP